MFCEKSVHTLIVLERIILRAARNLVFQAFAQRNEIALLKSRRRKHLAVVIDAIEKPRNFQLPASAEIARIRLQYREIVLLVDPDGLQAADFLVIIGDFLPCAGLGGRHIEIFPKRLLIENQAFEHLCDIAAPAERRRDETRLFRQRHWLARERAADRVRRLQRHQLVAQIRIRRRRAHNRPVLPRQAAQDVLPTCLVDAVVIGVHENRVLRRINQARRRLHDRILFIRKNAAAGQIDVLIRKRRHQRHHRRQRVRRISHEIDDAVIMILEESHQRRAFTGVRLVITHVGLRRFLFVQRNGVDFDIHFRQRGNKILPHRASRAYH